jgi:microcompartment protein CcmK/EutM
MIIGKVTGTVVTTISHPHYKNYRILVVQPLTVPGDKADGDFIAIDNTNAGIGDTVLVNREGGGARQVLNNPDACIISVIVGIVDSLFIKDMNITD